MPYIRVKYQSNAFDYVPDHLLDTLITFNQISHFYRPSERRWVSIRLDPMRGNGGCYQGPERRGTKMEPTTERQRAEEEFSNAKGYKTKWLQGFWEHIEGL